MNIFICIIVAFLSIVVTVLFYSKICDDYLKEIDVLKCKIRDNNKLKDELENHYKVISAINANTGSKYKIGDNVIWYEKEKNTKHISTIESITFDEDGITYNTNDFKSLYNRSRLRK